LKQRALIISSLLSWPFSSQWTSGSSKVSSLTVRFLMATGRQTATEPTTWRTSPPNLFFRGQGGPAIHPGTGYPF